MRRVIFITILLLLSNNVIADANSDGKDFAEVLNSKNGNIGAETDLNAVPGYKGQEVDEVKYYDQQNNFAEKAKEDAENKETTIYMRESSSKRPPIKIDPSKDPLFKRVAEIEDKSKYLSDNYSGCQKLPVGTDDVTKYNKKSCFEYGMRQEITFKCDKKLEVSCKNSNAGDAVPFNINEFSVSGPTFSKRDRGTNIYFGSETNDRNGGCTTFTNTISFNLKSIDEVVEFRIENFMFDDWITISLNGTTLYSEPFGHCERSQIFSKPGFDLRPYLKQGNNVLSIVNVVAGGGRAWINLKASRKISCDTAESYSYSCDGGRNHHEATLSASTCIEGSSSRNIRGTSILRNCWRWSNTFTTLDAPVYTKDQLCNELIQQGCGLVSNNCIENDPSYCKKREINYSCPYQESARFVEICSDQLVCSDGKCKKEIDKHDSTEDFKKAATAMEVARALSKELKEDQLEVFKGLNKECKENNLGFKNCCKDSGWGLDLGISECSGAEKELGLAKEDGRAHFIGSYKTGSAIDRRKYQSYCIYPSKIARIIIEQGKAQISKGFGEAKSPDCSGLTLTELESLDFSKVDFSEFYSDIANRLNSSNSPNIEESVAKFKESMERKLKETKEKT